MSSNFMKLHRTNLLKFLLLASCPQCVALASTSLSYVNQGHVYKNQKDKDKKTTLDQIEQYTREPTVDWWSVPNNPKILDPYESRIDPRKALTITLSIPNFKITKSQLEKVVTWLSGYTFVRGTGVGRPKVQLVSQKVQEYEAKQARKQDKGKGTGKKGQNQGSNDWSGAWGGQDNWGGENSLLWGGQNFQNGRMGDYGVTPVQSGDEQNTNQDLIVGEMNEEGKLDPDGWTDYKCTIEFDNPETRITPDNRSLRFEQERIEEEQFKEDFTRFWHNEDIWLKDCRDPLTNGYELQPIISGVDQKAQIYDLAKSHRQRQQEHLFGSSGQKLQDRRKQAVKDNSKDSKNENAFENQKAPDGKIPIKMISDQAHVFTCLTDTGRQGLEIRVGYMGKADPPPAREPNPSDTSGQVTPSSNAAVAGSDVPASVPASGAQTPSGVVAPGGVFTPSKLAPPGTRPIGVVPPPAFGEKLVG